MSRPVAILLASLALIAATGCGPQPMRYSAPSAVSPEAQTLDTHIAALERQIADLERGLGRGRGAYSQGSLLRVEGREKGEPPLDRLRRLEREIADAQAQVAARDTRITALTRELGSARDQGKALGEQAGDLAYAKDALVTAQQALTEARGDAEGYRAQLAASELQRLKAEREHYRFAAALLRVTPGQTTPLLQLQDEAREAARSLEIRPGSHPTEAPRTAEPTHAPTATQTAPAPAAHGGH